jgi:hypothetical protein
MDVQHLAIFVSKYSENSKNCLQEISKERLPIRIDPVFIDTKTDRDKARKLGISNVPTLFIAGKDGSKHLIEGMEKIIGWLNQFLAIMYKNAQQPPPQSMGGSNQPPYHPNQNYNPNINGIVNNIYDGNNQGMTSQYRPNNYTDPRAVNNQRQSQQSNFQNLSNPNPNQNLQDSNPQQYEEDEYDDDIVIGDDDEDEVPKRPIKRAPKKTVTFEDSKTYKKPQKTNTKNTKNVKKEKIQNTGDNKSTKNTQNTKNTRDTKKPKSKRPKQKRQEYDEDEDDNDIIIGGDDEVDVEDDNNVYNKPLNLPGLSTTSSKKSGKPSSKNQSDMMKRVELMNKQREQTLQNTYGYDENLLPKTN